MKSIALLVIALFVGIGAFAGNSRGQETLTPTISTNEGGCWDKCKTCEQQCRSSSGDAKRSCEDKCWTTNDTCCSGVGGKGVYKMCGCKDN